MTPDPVLVSPGTVGFLVTFAVVVAVIFLIRDAIKRVRRVQARAGYQYRHAIPVQLKENDSEAEPTQTEPTQAEGRAPGDTNGQSSRHQGGK